MVKKLKQPKKRKKKKSSEKKGEAVDGKEGKGGEEEEDEEDEEEEDKGGIRSLMIVKTAGEAWERLQERLKEAPIIQVRDGSCVNLLLSDGAKRCHLNGLNW